MEKPRLREYQDHMENSGWRIALIPFSDPKEPMKFETNWLGLLFMMIFLGSALFFVLSERSSPDFALTGMGFGLFGMLVSVFIRLRSKYMGWVKVSAKCIDRELKLGRDSLGKGYAWSWRWLCEYRLGGSTHRVTPSYWLSWAPGNTWAKRRATLFGNKVVDHAGNMELWINPKNPLQTEVAGQDIKDFLLHKRSNETVDSTATRVTPPASQESRHSQP